MLRKEAIQSHQEKNYLIMKIRLECLRMNELKHHLIKDDQAKEVIQDKLNWMHHQIRFYQNESDVLPLINHFNWLVFQFNQHLDDDSSKISSINT